MHPVLFEIPGIGFPIRSFGVLVAGGIFLSIWVWGKLLARHGDDPERDPVRGSQIALWVIVGVLVGARLMYVGVEVSRYLGAHLEQAQIAWLDARGSDILAPLEPEKIEAARAVAVGHDFVRDPLRILFLWQGGLVMYGGLLGGILFGALAAKHHGLRLWNAFDTALVSSFLGLAVGRWGCLLVGDDYGKVVPDAWRHLPFPITLRVPPAEWLAAHKESLFDHELAGQLIWCTQVWMSVNALLIAFIGWLLLRRRRRYGTPGLAMLVIYAMTRATIEAFRGDSIRGLWFGGTVSTSQIVSLAVGLFALVLLVRRPGRLAPGGA
jgi:phosphatidylglycerol:prolipoprotein diacylglycerol transferase